MTASQIQRIDGFELSGKLGRAYGNSWGVFNSRDSLFVRVTFKDGSIGWGETWAEPAAAAALIRTKLGPALLGEDGSNLNRLWDRMDGLRGFDAHGLNTMAASALDIALHDANARQQKKPLYDLLGGALRTVLPCYASGPFLMEPPDRYAGFMSEVARYLDAGFKAIKPRMGADLERDIVCAREMRRHVGPDIKLMTDFNKGLNARAALTFAERLEEYDFSWIEEPIASDDLAGHIRLAREMKVPLAGGESLIGLKSFADYLTKGALEIVQPDLALCGGFSTGRRIAALAEAANVPVMPHVWGGIINFRASAHWLATLRQATVPHVTPLLFEFDQSENPTRSVLGEPASDGNGNFILDDAPGLGIELTPAVLEPLTTHAWTLENS